MNKTSWSNTLGEQTQQTIITEKKIGWIRQPRVTYEFIHPFRTWNNPVTHSGNPWVTKWTDPKANHIGISLSSNEESIFPRTQINSPITPSKSRDKPTVNHQDPNFSCNSSRTKTNLPKFRSFPPDPTLTLAPKI